MNVLQCLRSRGLQPSSAAARVEIRSIICLTQVFVLEVHVSLLHLRMTPEAGLRGQASLTNAGLVRFTDVCRISGAPTNMLTTVPDMDILEQLQMPRAIIIINNKIIIPIIMIIFFFMFIINAIILIIIIIPVLLMRSAVLRRGSLSHHCQRSGTNLCQVSSVGGSNNALGSNVEGQRACVNTPPSTSAPPLHSSIEDHSLTFLLFCRLLYCGGECSNHSTWMRLLNLALTLRSHKHPCSQRICNLGHKRRYVCNELSFHGSYHVVRTTPCWPSCLLPVPSGGLTPSEWPSFREPIDGQTCPSASLPSKPRPNNSLRHIDKLKHCLQLW